MKSVKVMALVVILLLVGSGVVLAMHHEPTIENGKKLFNDTKLGTSGKSCGSCHPNGKGMEKAGAKTNLAAMINTCITKPLQGKALDEKSLEMQSLVLYIRSLAKM